jgi:hypothetical protein
MEKKTGGAAAARAGHVEGWRNHCPWDDQHHSESCDFSTSPCYSCFSDSDDARHAALASIYSFLLSIIPLSYNL